MPHVRSLVLCFVVVACGGVGVLLAACSSDSNGGGPSDAGLRDAAADDASLAIDGALGPVFCGLPLPSICPMTAPCAWSTLGCSLPACDGYFVVTDGVWVDYYSASGGALAGEVAVGDAGIVSCPYGFIPPTSCTPTLLSQCSDSDGGSDASSLADASPHFDADAGTDASLATDASLDAEADVPDGD